MSAIDPTQALTAYLRGQLGGLSGPLSPLRAAAKTGAATRGAQGATTPKPASANAARTPGEDLASSIARRVAVIDRQDPDRRRKAFRVFLESLLLQEWGGHLINDPGFHQLVGDVQAQMEADPRLGPLINEAADQLLGPAAR